MSYLHGVRVQENPTSIPTPITSNAGVPVVIGTAPINLADDPTGATNIPIMCNSFAEAKAALGYSSDYANYTLCQAMDAFFKAFCVAPVVFINVLDPTTHKAAITEETLTVTSGIAKSSTKGMILSSVVVKDGATTLVEDTDYTLSFDDDGGLVITVIASGVTSVKLTGDKLTPASVTATTIVGSYTALTGTYTGIECVSQIYPMFNRFPSLLLAPGWSQNSTVGLALAMKCEGLNGSFRCECVVDLPSNTGNAVVYSGVKTVKDNLGYVNPHMIVCWPEVLYAGKQMYMSAMYAAMALYTDISNDDVPNLYLSNKALRISGVVLHDGTAVNLDQTQAGDVNGDGVVTALNLNGFKVWGNNTAAYPDTTDPKDRWIGCRRFFSWWGDNFIVIYLSKVDDPANKRLIESIVDSENVRGNALVSAGKCAGIRTEYDPDDNPVANILDGKIVFRQYMAPYTPAEDILDIIEYDVSMLEAELGGE